MKARASATGSARGQTRAPSVRPAQTASRSSHQPAKNSCKLTAFTSKNTKLSSSFTPKSITTTRAYSPASFKHLSWSTKHYNFNSNIFQAKRYSGSGPGGLPASFALESNKDNTEDTPFDFTPENFEEVKRIIAKYPEGYKQGACIPLLHLAQKQHNGWLPLAAMQKVAKILEMPDIRVFEVVTFYTMFNRKPVGTHVLQVCTTTPCMLRGAYDVLDTCKKHLNIGVGETTKDKKFTLMEVECLGACVNAPMIQVNDDYYEDLTPETTIKVLDTLAAGQSPKVGPQNGRICSMGPQGKTTLLEEPYGPGFGMRTDL